MKLLIPINSVNDVKCMIKYGKELEFYVGVTLQSWYNLFGPYEELNRMSAFHHKANINNVFKLKQIVNAAKGYKIYITLNSGIYSIKQIDFLKEFLIHIKEIGVTGVIVGDIHLAPIVNLSGLQTIASTMIGVYNADIAKYCQENGFQRLILPRDLTLNEIGQITAAVPDIEYECFLMRNGCRYSDSNCMAQHSDRYGALCTHLDRAKYWFGGISEHNYEAHDAIVFNHLLFSHAFHKEACGICAIWDLMKIGITAGKVVGRADGMEAIEDDVKLLRRNLEIAHKCISREEYLKYVQFPRRYNSICYQGLNCYYPEIRYGGHVVEKT